MSILDDLLENKELADELEISIGDKTAKVGDLRALRSESSRTRTERDAIAADRDAIRGERDNLTRSVTDLLGKAGRMTDDDTRQRPIDPRDAVTEGLAALLKKDDPSEALWKDPTFGGALTQAEERAYARAKKDYDGLAATVNEIRENVQNGFTSLTKAQVYERENRWYDINRKEIPNGEDGKKVSLTQLRQYAAERQMFIPGTQLLDYDAALGTLTEPTRRAEEMTAAERRGYEKGIAAARTKSAEVIPLFGDRSAGGGGAPAIKTAGKTQKQIVQESLQRGLADLSAGNE
jgi:hypothetical protein